MNSQEIKEAARGQWQYILPRVGIPASNLKNKHQPCPMCGGKDRSMRFRRRLRFHHAVAELPF